MEMLTIRYRFELPLNYSMFCFFLDF